MSTNSQAAIPEKLVSALLVDDQDVVDLVAGFVEGLSRRLNEFRLAFEQHDWGSLASLAHQLKGAGGSYGYGDLSRLAKTMEDAFQAHSAGQFEEWMAQFEKLIAAARAGLQS